MQPFFIPIISGRKLFLSITQPSSMPRYENRLSLQNINPSDVLAICYSSFQKLGWTIKYASKDKLVAYTPSPTFSKSMEVITTYAEGELIVSSEMINDELMDLKKKNQKNVEVFLAEFEQTKRSITAATIEANKQSIKQLTTETITAAEQEIKEIAELNEAMNLDKGSLTVTYAIIGINVLVFLIMGLQGAGVFEANGLVHLRWGSNYGPLTASGDWWRLLTATFLHFGIIHLALNMYALFSIAAYLEPMLGKLRYITAYLCCAILASLTSLWWHTEPVNSAGASGAVFGMYGVFLALLTTNLIPKKVRGALLQSIVIFVIYNLAYGIKGGIDNAAHIGGLVSGMLIGYLFAFIIKKEKKQQTASWVVPAVVLLSVFICGWYLQQNKTSAEERSALLFEIKNAGYPDTERFNELYNQFVALQDEAMRVYDEYSQNITGLPTLIQEKAMPKWDEAENIANRLQKLDVSDELKLKAVAVKKYIGLRKKEMELQVKIMQQPVNATVFIAEQELVRQDIEKELIKLK